MIDSLINLWIKLLELWLTPLWNNLGVGFWRILAGILVTAIVAAFSCRKTLARWVIGKQDDTVADRRVFKELDEIASEPLVNDALNSQYAYRWINDDALSRLSEVGPFLTLTENRFLSRQVRRAAVRLTTDLETLLRFSGQHFSDLHLSGPGRRYALRPEWDVSDKQEERTRYEQAARELDVLVKCAWRAYKQFRLAVKIQLRA